MITINILEDNVEINGTVYQKGDSFTIKADDTYPEDLYAVLMNGQAEEIFPEIED